MQHKIQAEKKKKTHSGNKEKTGIGFVSFAELEREIVIPLIELTAVTDDCLIQNNRRNFGLYSEK